MDGGRTRPSGRQARGRPRHAGRPRTGRSRTAESKKQLTEEQALALSRSRPNARYETSFGGVPSFRGALLNAGLEEDECAAIEQALQHIVDFRRCRPEHRLVVERDETAGLKRFEYHPSATEFVEVTRGEDGLFRAEQIRVKVERTPSRGPLRWKRRSVMAWWASDFPPAWPRFSSKPSKAKSTSRCRRARATFSGSSSTRNGWTASSSAMAVCMRSSTTGSAPAKCKRSTIRAGNTQGQFYDDSGRAMQGGWLRTPLRYDRLSSRYNPRRFHPILKRTVPHLGVDYAAATGTPVWAAADGRVTFAGRKGPNGNLVVIRHGGGFETAYAHLHRIKGGIRRGSS